MRNTGRRDCAIDPLLFLPNLVFGMPGNIQEQTGLTWRILCELQQPELREARSRLEGRLVLASCSLFFSPGHGAFFGEKRRHA